MIYGLLHRPGSPEFEVEGGKRNPWAIIKLIYQPLSG